MSTRETASQVSAAFDAAEFWRKAGKAPIPERGLKNLREAEAQSKEILARNKPKEQAK